MMNTCADLVQWLSPEPLLQSPRYVATMARVGMSVPTYAYAANNPLRYTDPTGLEVQNNSPNSVVVKIDADPSNSQVVVLPPGETYGGTQDAVYTGSETVKTVDGTHAIVNPDGTVDVITTGAKQTVGQGVLGGRKTDEWVDKKKWPLGKDQRRRIGDADKGAVCR